MSMERALYEIIKTLPVPGDRIYALRAPQNVKAPFVIYQRVDTAPWRDINGPATVGQATMQIDVYAVTYKETKELAASLQLLLDGYRGTVAYGGDSPQATIRFGGISLQNSVDLLDQSDAPFLYRVSADYLITFAGT